MRGSVTPFLVCTFNTFIINSAILLLDLQCPAYVKIGGPAELVCIYDLEYDGFYSLKWYKDGLEFYSFIPRLNDPKRFFDISGVNVNKNSSNNFKVYLENITPESAGEYKCQVSGEGPLFSTFSQSKILRAAVLPKLGPKIVPFPGQHHPGDWVNLNCSSLQSNPPVRLTWFVNGKEASYDKLNTFDSLYPTTNFLKPHLAKNSSGVDTQKNEKVNRTQTKVEKESMPLYDSILGLQFWVHEEDFENGKLLVSCHANISDIYFSKTETFLIGEHVVGTDKAMHALSRAHTKFKSDPVVASILLVVRLLTPRHGRVPFS